MLRAVPVDTGDHVPRAGEDTRVGLDGGGDEAHLGDIEQAHDEHGAYLCSFAYIEADGHLAVAGDDVPHLHRARHARIFAVPARASVRQELPGAVGVLSPDASCASLLFHFAGMCADAVPVT